MLDFSRVHWLLGLRDSAPNESILKVIGWFENRTRNRLLPPSFEGKEGSKWMDDGIVSENI